MSESDQVRLSYIKETTFGTTPSGSLQVLRYSSDSFKRSTGTTESPEIGSRRVKDVARTSLEAVGGFNFILSWDNLKDWLEAVLFADATYTTEETTTDNTISASATDDSFNGTGEFTNYAVNDWIEATGWVSGNNKGFHKIITKPDNDKIIVATTLTTESAAVGKNTVLGGFVEDGTKRTSFSIEKEFQDLTNIFQSFVGVVPSEITLAAETGGDALVSGSITCLGKNSALPVATIGTGYTVAPTNRLYNTVDHVKSIVEAAAAITSNGFNFTLSNSLRGLQNLGVLGADDIKAGGLSISGQVTQFFTDTNLITKYDAFTDSSLALIIDGDGGAYIVDFPAVNYSDAEILAGGKNQDVIASLPFIVKEHATQAIMVRITKFTG